MPRDKRAWPFNITLRSADSTLGEEQVNAAMKRIIKALEKNGCKAADVIPKEKPARSMCLLFPNKDLRADEYFSIPPCIRLKNAL